MQPTPSAAERHDRSHRRAMRVGLVVSLLFHLAILFWARAERIPPSPFAAAGERTGDEQAAAGGGMQAVELRIAEPQPIPRPPEPILVPDIEVETPEPEETEVEPVDLAALGQAGTTPGRSEGDSPGVEQGTGTGDGGTSDAGRFRVVPPNPRGLFIPPDAPRSLRGRPVTVYVFVNDRGRVVPDSTRLSPSSGDRRFDRALIGRANEWRFEPAQREGRAVAEWFNWEFTLGDG